MKNMFKLNIDASKIYFQAWRAGVCPRSGRSKSLPTGLAHHLLDSQCGSFTTSLTPKVVFLPSLTFHYHINLLICPVLLFYYLSPGSLSVLPPWPSSPHQLKIFISAAVQLDVSVLSRPRLFAPNNLPLSYLMVLWLILIDVLTYLCWSTFSGWEY